MTMADKMTGPIWLSWVITAIFLIISVILITGHGSGLIAGYNTASKEEKEMVQPVSKGSLHGAPRRRSRRNP